MPIAKALASLFSALCRRPRLVVFLTIIIVIFCGSQLPRLNVDLSLGQRFVGGEEAVETYDDFVRTFGSEPSLAVVVQAREGTIGDDDSYERIGELTDALSRVDGIERAVSIGSIPGFDIPPDRLATLPLVRKLLVGTRGTASTILVEPHPSMLAPSEGRSLVERVRKVVEHHSHPKLQLEVVGPLALQTASIHYAREDLKTVTAIAFLAVTLLLGVAFRSVRAAAGPIVVAIVTVVMTLGILAAAGVSLSQFALIAVPVLVGLSVLDGVHIVHAHLPFDGGGSEGVVEKVLAKEVTPCFWTSMTTLIGFAVLVTSPIAQVRSIGLVMAIGVPLSFVASFTVLPSLMALRGGLTPRVRMPDPFVRGAGALSRFVEQRCVGILLVSLILFVVAVIGLARLQVSLDFPHLFRKGTPVHLGESASLEVMLDAGRPGAFKEVEVIKRVASLSQALSLSANVTTTVSYLDVGASALLANDVDTRGMKFDDETVELLVATVEGQSADMLRRWMSKDFSRARIHVKLRTARPELHDRLVAALRYLKGSFAEWFDVRPTGFGYLYKSMERVMLESFLATFCYALIGIVIVLMIIARSLKRGCASVLANLLPIAIVLGIMGWLGIGISVGMIILPAVGLGLLADDTIHFLIALKRAGGTGRQAVEDALRATGWPIVMTQLILLAVFGSLLASHFSSNITLGIFMSLLLIVGLAFDLLFVPAFVIIWEREKNLRR